MRRLAVPGGVIGGVLLLALAAPLLGLPDPLRQDVAHRLAGPMPGSPLGRDEFGRDVLSRLVWGARTSLAVAFASATVACVLGTTLGLIGGWFRGIWASLANAGVEVVLCVPPVLLALLVVTLLGPGATTLILVLSVLFLPGFSRVAYAEVLAARGLDFVEAVRALGASPVRMLVRTILPNIAGPVLVQLSLALAAAITLESGLSFLGLGVVPPLPSWGLMIRGGRAVMEQQPLLLLWPCLALSGTILAMNLLCDALRDAADPRGIRPALRLMDRLLPGLLPATGLVLEVRGLSVEVATRSGLMRPVEDVGFSVAAGQTLAIVGESGSGKSLTALAVMGLLPPAARVSTGSAAFDRHDLLRLDEPTFRRLRGTGVAMVFQDPMSSLDPVMRVGAQLREAMGAQGGDPVALFRRVGIADPARRLQAYPHELSGGMRQRVMIAMALAGWPRLLIADEPTTALDVTVQAQILDLLTGLQRETGLAMILITHSLAVVAETAQTVAVMYAGQIVEQGPVGDIFARPLHPYTRALLDAVPEGDAVPAGIGGVVPRPDAWPPGCRFAPRCAHALAACAASQPALEAVGARQVRCLRWAELQSIAA